MQNNNLNLIYKNLKYFSDINLDISLSIIDVVKEKDLQMYFRILYLVQEIRLQRFPFLLHQKTWVIEAWFYDTIYKVGIQMLNGK